MPAKAHFTPALFRFLRDLRANNDPPWFQANRSRYEEDVKVPLLAFVADFARPLGRISRHFVADPRPVGGSMFRIHRDTRFSPDKSPYKTHAAVQFRHEAGKDVHAPGFYLHLEPGNVFAAAGLWRPDADALARIRDAIVSDPAAWKRIVASRSFRERVALEGDSLSRAPRGYDPAHPLADDLRRKDFVGTVGFSQREACSAGFLDRVAGAFGACGPLVRFLTQALELEF